MLKFWKSKSQANPALETVQSGIEVNEFLSESSDKDFAELIPFQEQFQLYWNLSHGNESDRVWFNEVLEDTEESERSFIAKLVNTLVLYVKCKNSKENPNYELFLKSQKQALKFARPFVTRNSLRNWQKLDPLCFGELLMAAMFNVIRDLTPARIQANEERWSDQRRAPARFSASNRGQAQIITGSTQNSAANDVALAQNQQDDSITDLTPASRLIRTARDAEEVVSEWMIHFGFSDAKVTPIGPDAGIDVISSEAVVQVKMESVPTSRPAVQQLYGVAASKGLQPFFFALAGFTKDAVNWGTEQEIALFTFDYSGKPKAVNGIAASYIGVSD
jgi:hypothetical protein